VFEFITGDVLAQDALGPWHERDIAQSIALIGADVAARARRSPTRCPRGGRSRPPSGPSRSAMRART
jgi:hypothetical protein